MRTKKLQILDIISETDSHRCHILCSCFQVFFSILFSVVTCVYFDGDKIISGSADSNLRIWLTKSARCQHVLKGHEGEVVGLKPHIS